MLPSQWDTLRKQVYARHGHQCSICGAAGPLHCHEQWVYDERMHVQKLMGFVALCTLCHLVKHLGLAGVLVRQGKLDFERVVRHFMIVNGCDRQTFEAHRRATFREWQERSEHEWLVDLGAYQRLVRRG